MENVEIAKFSMAKGEWLGQTSQANNSFQPSTTSCIELPGTLIIYSIEPSNYLAGNCEFCILRLRWHFSGSRK